MHTEEKRGVVLFFLQTSEHLILSFTVNSTKHSRNKYKNSPVTLDNGVETRETSD